MQFIYKNFTLLQPLKKLGFDMGSLRYERIMLERRPFGGSFVIFTPEMVKTK